MAGADIGAGTVTVVVMAWNEVESLAPVVDEIGASLDGLPAPTAHEILIVDDGSHDGTSELADQLARDRPRVRVIHHGDNRGLGGVYRTGFAEARGTYLSFFPADGQFPAEILATFFPLMASHDLVLGNIPRADAGPLAMALSLGERVLYRGLFGSMPRFQGVFMLRRALLEQLPLHTQGRGWGVVMEMVLRLHRGGRRLTSVRTPFRPRMSGQSKVNNLRGIWSNLKQALLLRRTLDRS